MWDISGSVGGPIKRDKVWFWASFRINDVSNEAPIFVNKNAFNPNEWLYVPDVALPGVNKGEQLNTSIRVTEQAVDGLRQTAREGRENWTLLAAATCGIALALALIFVYLVARPIRQIDDAIRQIGRADFDHPIVVNGPPAPR